jgi:hypothetical protein
MNITAWLTSWLPLAWQPKQILAMRQRASQWKQLRAEHLLKEPRCAACGRSTELAVHHVIPVSFDESRQLDPGNLITLCAQPCHIVFGHFMNYQCYNKDVRKMAADYKRALHKRKCLHAELRLTTYADRPKHP